MGSSRTAMRCRAAKAFDFGRGTCAGAGSARSGPGAYESCESPAGFVLGMINSIALSPHHVKRAAAPDVASIHARSHRDRILDGGDSATFTMTWGDTPQLRAEMTELHQSVALGAQGCRLSLCPDGTRSAARHMPGKPSQKQPVYRPQSTLGSSRQDQQEWSGWDRKCGPIGWSPKWPQIKNQGCSYDRETDPLIPNPPNRKLRNQFTRSTPLETR